MTLKTFILSLILTISSTAMADLSLECEKTNGRQGVTLDLVDGWRLRDPSESSLRRAIQMEPTEETRRKVVFLYDFGSDNEKMQYQFVGMNKCGIYDETVKVVTLTKSLKSFNGRLRNPEVQRCSCIED